MLFTGKRTKAWYFQKNVGGHTKRILIGRYPTISADAARKTALGLSLEMSRGAGKQVQTGAPLLKDAIEAYLARPRLRSEVHKHGVRSQLHNKLKDWLWLPLDEISKSMVVERHRVMAKVPSAANHTFRQFRTIWNHARRTHGPAGIPHHGNRMVSGEAGRPHHRRSRLVAGGRRSARETQFTRHSIGSCSSPACGSGRGQRHILRTPPMIASTSSGADQRGICSRRAARGFYNSSGDAEMLAFTMSFSLAIGAGIAWSLVATAFGLVALVAAAIALAMLRRETPASVARLGLCDRLGHPRQAAFTRLLAAVFPGQPGAGRCADLQRLPDAGYAVPPGYRRTAPVKRPKLDGFTELLDAWLREDAERPRKQRHTAKRVLDRLREEHGFTAAKRS